MKRHIVSFVYSDSLAIPIHFKDVEQIDAAFEAIDQAHRSSLKIAVFEAAYGKASVEITYLAAFARSEEY